MIEVFQDERDVEMSLRSDVDEVRCFKLILGRINLNVIFRTNHLNSSSLQVFNFISIC